ncbi:hypothetical protein [Rhizorhabdus dicambivorans]|uniref:Uncharacterized protein n=1 Tax=Rhizorhabdus dicambivorans TaxID=1850238 RepID=A0A2A4FZF8_9SPHN|nr:hypothetical protein [Rhizorhabdus dicambivorans]ATE63382.1 hypothetical protein CMV14_02345 [Rhizorhabdus dicambivorans]PCE43598.1 hypothetical protein COO09_04665 [Rhizorhabdus dicambivorans]
MTDPTTLLTMSGAALIGLCVLAWAALSGWRGWLELERMKFERRGGAPVEPAASPSPAARIELADLKERVRKLEAIAAGVDL